MIAPVPCSTVNGPRSDGGSGDSVFYIKLLLTNEIQNKMGNAATAVTARHHMTMAGYATVAPNLRNKL
jgi:hypothetical protein